MDVSKEVLWYGKNEPLAENKIFHAGSLEVNYDTGNLRNIRIGNHEILRMIYVTLRDQNWGTLLPIIENEKIKSNASEFSIEYDSIYHENNIHFHFHVSITGDDQNTVVFEINGEALSEFQTNRTGLCVLHPIGGYTGLDCEITTPDGEKLHHKFPELISPHQPMKNIMEMSWMLEDVGIAKIIFEGEVFEMEDQRNWTDDSYKTYCRPLTLPYPYTLKKGDKIHQKIILAVQNTYIKQNHSDKEYHFKYDPNKKITLPKIGIGRATSKSPLGIKEMDLIHKVGFDFYDVSVVFNEFWKPDLKNAIIESKRMNLPLKLKVLFSVNFENEIKQLSTVLTETEASVIALLILEKDALVTSDGFITKILQPLKKAFPDIKIGGGTLGFFAGLNRNRIENDALDFISFSMNPQVHAFDNQTLIENLKGQSATVITAKSFSDPKEIHISPITFKIQKNLLPNTLESDSKKEYLEHIDERQMSLFGAGWTLGSIKNLAESGTDVATYFETIGEKGIIQGEKNPRDTQFFQVKSGAVFPLYYIFKEVLNNKNANVLHSVSSHPELFEGMILESENKKTILLANFTAYQIEIRIEDIALGARVKKLDEKNVLKAMYDHEVFEMSPFCDFQFEQPITTIKLRPFGLAIIKE